MKHTQLKLCFLVLLLFSLTVRAQQQPSTPGYSSPAGLLDNVFDRLGNSYALRELEVDVKKTGKKTTTVVAGCSSGYFQMYLETGCGMEGTDPVAIARLQVLCRVLSDISQFISSPCTSTGQKINIWVRNPASVGGGFLAVASSYYNIPYSTTKSGIQDHAIWITANSGVDAYKNTTAPLYMSSASAGYGASYYHGMMAFVCDSSILWHTDLATPPATGEYDLYTVALHEIMHALGFASLISYNGNSAMGTGFKYFNRYDRHLKTTSGANLLTNPGTACGMYDWTFNATLTPAAVLSPGSTAATCPTGYQTGPFVNHTVCANAIKYVGSTTQPVYTPSCYEKGSSLSHFEDECAVPAGFALTPPASNDQYFVMCNASTPGPYSASGTPGAMKRYPSPEEKQVFCDIGYTVNTTYGNAANLNYKNYGGTVCGEHLAGINDGITPAGTFAYYALGTTPVTINGGSAGSLLDNDFGATGFKCLEVITGAGTISATSGTSTTPITFTASSGTVGIQLLRYIPVSASGAEGNITYVYVSIGDINCTPSACDLVNNGSFEDVLTDGCDNTDISTAVSCWSPYAQTPDIFGRSPICAAVNMGIPCTGAFSPAVDVHPLSTLPNDHFMGMFGNNTSSGFVVEASQAPLTSSLIPGGTYVIGFWAIMGNYGALLQLPSTFELAVTPAMGVLPYYPSSFVPTTPPGLTSVLRLSIDHPKQWHYYTKTVTYTGAVPANAMVVMNAAYLNPPSFPATYMTYMIIDDLSIKPIGSAVSFTLPDTMCFSALLKNLNDHVSVRGGTFTWLKDVAGVPTITHDTLLDPVSAYNATTSSIYPGSITVSYAYTDAVGCSQIIYATTHLKPLTFSVSSSVTAACSGAPVALTCTGAPGYNYSWSPAVTCMTPPCNSALITPTVSTTYTITETTTHCQAFLTLPVISASDIIGPTQLCVGSAINYTNLTPGGTWGSSVPAVAPITAGGLVTALSPGTTTIRYMNLCEQVSAKVVTVNAAVPAITGIFTLPVGATTVLSNATAGGTWTSSAIGIATVDAVSGTTTAVSPGTTAITYTTTEGCYTTIEVTVTPHTGVDDRQHGKAVFSLAPNPSKGAFIITGNRVSQSLIEDINIDITDMWGRSIYKDAIPAKNSSLAKPVSIGNDLPEGIYMMRLRSDEINQVLQIRISR